jgi:predicted aldo/keto reductase-like oxidoreductase
MYIFLPPTHIDNTFRMMPRTYTQFIGSYTSSGSGPSGTGGNLCAIEAAKKHDMGVFIISPTDKGGALYEPPRKLYKACLPLTPIAFNNLWLWAHPEDTTPIHTLVIGCARPADFDEHLESAMLYPQRRELVAPIQEKLHAMVKDTFGPDFMTTWYKGLPDPYENDEGVYVCYLYWLWWICKAWGMHKYAQNRYGPQQDALKRWDDSKTPDENRSGECIYILKH